MDIFSQNPQLPKQIITFIQNNPLVTEVVGGLLVEVFKVATSYMLQEDNNKRENLATLTPNLPLPTQQVVVKNKEIFNSVLQGSDYAIIKTNPNTTLGGEGIRQKIGAFINFRMP